jgi:exopolyphosphatase/guanosine-5'-triphosphate,3'-diphosphate pyrophosphatase
MRQSEVMGPDVLAAVDLGTNSVHLVVAKVEESRFEVIEREREMVRLGSSGGDMKRLAPDAMDRGIAALGRFRQVAEIYGARARAVATSAVREAENQAEFLERARDEAGVDVEVISGFEEARLIHLGVLQAVPVFDRRLLVCDIGGGSTELVVGHTGDVLFSRSLKLGAIRLSQRFFPDGRSTSSAVDDCRSYVREALAPFKHRIKRLDVEVAVGSSGTIGAVFAMVAAQRDGPIPRTYNNFAISRDEIKATVRQLVKAKTVEDRTAVPGLEAKRADIILGGALILDEVVRELGVDELVYSDYALREGVLLDTWQRAHGASLHHLSDLRRRSVLHLVDLMDEDPDHSAQMAQLALQLFDGTCIDHGLGDDSREVLEAGALLSNVGLFVSHSGHHKHSYYVIRNSEQMTGFTDSEIELIAQVARYHRKSAPKESHPEFAALGDDDKRRVRILAGMLRIAVGLDRDHGGRVEKVQCSTDGEHLVITAVPHPDADISLELHAAAQRVDLLERALDRKISVVAPDGEA